MSDYEVNGIIDRMSRHTQKLENHRYVYKILLIISIVLLAISVAFIGGLFGAVKKEEKTNTFKTLAYAAFGLIGTSILILTIVVYFRYLKEGTDNISGLNSKVRQLGDMAKRAQTEASNAQNEAAAQKIRALQIRDAARVLSSDIN